MFVDRRQALGLIAAGALHLGAAPKPAPPYDRQPSGDLGNGFYRNPIIMAGDIADISAIRVGHDYYLIHYHTCSPGFPIWHSRDLVNWQPVKRLMPRRGGEGELCQYGEYFYHFFGVNRKLMVRRAPHPLGPWGDAVTLGVDSFDVAHIATPDGRRYIVSGSAGANLFELSRDGFKVISGPQRIYDGWPIPKDWDIECPCEEGWNIIYRNGYYYLTGAQGGTSGPPTAHMVVAARARSMHGPWEHSPYNPILRTQCRDEPFWAQGHAKLIDTPDGKWYMFYHAYLKGHWNLGRVINLVPIEWTADGWFRVPEGLRPDQPIAKPAGEAVPHGFRLVDDFAGPELDVKWGFEGESAEGRYRFGPGGLLLKAVGSNIANTAPMVMPVTHTAYEFEVEMTVPPGAEGGITVFFSHAAQAGVALKDGEILEYGRQTPFLPRTPYEGNHVFLKLEFKDDLVRRYYSQDGKSWTRLRITSEVSGFHRNALGPAAGLRPGIFACGEGEVTVRRFRLRGLA